MASVLQRQEAAGDGYRGCIAKYLLGTKCKPPANNPTPSVPTFYYFLKSEKSLYILLPVQFRDACYIHATSAWGYEGPVCSPLMNIFDPNNLANVQTDYYWKRLGRDAEGILKIIDAH